MRFILHICIFTVCLVSCMPNDNLPIKNVGNTPEYFIECYCKPGQQFVLSATTVMPISQKLVVDFSKKMAVNILANKNIDLYQKIFQLPGSDFIYNYGCEEIFHPVSIDSLFLNIITSDMTKITSKTAVPPSVEIYSYKLTEKEAEIYFQIAENPNHNYYIYTVEFMEQENLKNKEVRYLDYSQQFPYTIVQKGVQLPGQSYDKVILNLKRITKENYDYQISLNAANTANQSSITTPVPLKGNIQGALGIFTCYAEDQQVINISEQYK